MAAPVALVAQEQDWCEDDGERDRARYCEVREFTLTASGSIEVDARPNGGIQVEAWDRSEVLVRARVVGNAEEEDRAREIADQVDIGTTGTVQAEGPDTERREWWSVSYRVYVPAGYDLRLNSMNGGISVNGVRGELEMETMNGGLHLENIGGDVQARTTNGGLSVRLTGDRWQGAGLDAQTTNGSVTLEIPEGYSADLEAGTTNGGFSVDFPVTVSGKIERRLSTALGSGGAPIRVITTNGGVRLQRPEG